MDDRRFSSREWNTVRLRSERHGLDRFERVEEIGPEKLIVSEFRDDGRVRPYPTLDEIEERER